MHFRPHLWNLLFCSILRQFSCLPSLTNYSVQKSEPTVHVLQTSMLSLARKIANCIVKPQVLVDAKITRVDLTDEEMVFSIRTFFLMELQSTHATSSLNEGDIT